MAELAACNTCAEAVIADADRLILECICEIVLALGHGSDKYTNALSWSQGLDIVSHADHFSIKAKGDFPTVRRKMVCDWVLDDLEKLLLRVSRPDGQLVKQLNHEPCEAFEGTRNAHGRADLDEDAPGGMDVDLKLACLVHWRIEESQKTL